MEPIPEPKFDGHPTARPAAVTAAGWVMLVGSVVGGIASAAAFALLLGDLETGSVGLWRFELPEYLMQFAAAVVGCLLAVSVWRGVRSARAWTFCLGGVVATITAIRAGYGLVYTVTYLVDGDVGNSLSFLGIAGLNLVVCAVAAVPVLLLANGAATAWFAPGRPVPSAPAIGPLLALTAAGAVALPLLSAVSVLIGDYTPMRDFGGFLANQLIAILVPVLVITVAFGGRRSATPPATAAAFAAFGFACYRGPRAVISSNFDGWFGDIGSFTTMVTYLALLVIGIIGLRLLLRGGVPRPQPPMAPDPHR